MERKIKEGFYDCPMNKNNTQLINKTWIWKSFLNS
jgi:hypothetical protein